MKPTLTLIAQVHGDAILRYNGNVFVFPYSHLEKIMDAFDVVRVNDSAPDESEEYEYVRDLGYIRKGFKLAHFREQPDSVGDLYQKRKQGDRK